MTKEEENLFTDMQESNEENVTVADDDAPSRFSPEWNDYVLGLFLADEFQEGNPTVDGLRRVSQLLFGEIVNEYPKTVVGTPDFAVVEYTVQFENGVQVAAVAESNNRNNGVPPFCHFPLAIAETRAQGRVLRKALGLRKVVSAEEMAVATESVPNDFGSYITGVQIKAINKLCQKSDIDVIKFVNQEKTYTSISEVSKEDAHKMIEQLNKYNADSTNVDKVSVPDSIKGYKKDWRNT